MRIALLISLATALGICSVVANASTTRSDCGLRSTTIKGRKAVVYCGPATASLRVGGKTYTFKNGTCIWAGSLILTIGTQVNGVPASANNEGAPLIQLSGSVGTGTAYAFSGRFHLGMSLIKLTTHGHSAARSQGESRSAPHAASPAASAAELRANYSRTSTESTSGTYGIRHLAAAQVALPNSGPVERTAGELPSRSAQPNSRLRSHGVRQDRLREAHLRGDRHPLAFRGRSDLGTGVGAGS